MSTDVVVIGAGLVGLTAAAALARGGATVVVIDRGPPPAAPLAGTVDLRVSTFTRASEQVLRHVGAWQRLPASRVFPFEAMRVWEDRAEVRYDCADVGLGSLGCVVENRVVLHALREALASDPKVRLCHDEELVALDLDGDLARIETSRQRLRATLVVGADGAASRARDLAGIEAVRGDYRQRALVANVETSLSNRHTAWQRFLPTGPLAFLPMGEHASSIVWSTGETEAAVLQTCPHTAFETGLAEAIEHRLGEIRLTGERAAFPLHHLRASRYVRSRLALVGDAAHTVHPLAGQGVNLGILDAAALAEVVERARARGRDIGGYGNLRRYERWRRGHNELMRLSMSGFKYLFESTLPLVGAARRAGLVAADRLPAVKQRLMRFASGVDGDLPRIARPVYAVDGLPPPG